MVRERKIFEVDGQIFSRGKEKKKKGKERERKSDREQEFGGKNSAKKIRLL